MEEDLADATKKAADVLHWLGKHDVANALTLLSRLLRMKQIHTVDEMENYVEAAETDRG